MENPLLALSRSLAAAVERAAPSIVAVHARSRIPSSGVIFSDGIIVTADHTIDREDEIHLTLHHGARKKAELVGRDSGTDIAVLRSEAVLTPLAPTASELRAGTIVLAVGRSGESGIHASMGIVSLSSGPWHTWRGGKLDRMLRLDVRLHPGTSGGAVLDAEGSLVGIATGGLSRYWPTAIPVSTLERVAREIVDQGRVRRAYLGVGFQPVVFPQHLKDSLKLDASAGLIVVSTEPDAPAARAGVTLGDIIVSISGQKVSDIADVQAVLASTAIGNVIELSIVRGGERRALEVQVGERPQSSRR
jgi:S1-C subfamily serine protease